MGDITHSGWTGINNRDRIWELKVPTKDDPRSDLSAAQNFDLDNAGFPSVRLGRKIKVSMSGAHSGFSAYGCTVYVKGGVLYRLHIVTKASTPLLRVGTDDKMRYWAAAGRILFTNGLVLGEVVDGAASLFSPYSKGDKDAMPAGQAISFFRGKLLVFEGTVLYESEPAHLALTDMERSFKQFPDTGVIIAPTSDGLYVGTTNAMYYGAGGVLGKMSFIQVGDFGAKDIPIIYADAASVSGLRLEGRFPVMATNDGICLGLPQGQLYNMTKGKYVMPEGSTGSAMIMSRNGVNHYITVYR